jgi:hypothetical protein
MFLTSGFFWFLMGIIFVIVVIGFKAFADDKGWVITWWKWLLAAIWYAIFSITLLGWGTLIGENESGAGLKFFLFGLVVSIILGVGLWRLLVIKPKGA